MKIKEIKEIWKDIPNYEGHYKASNYGRIKSIKYNKSRILKQQIFKVTKYNNVDLSKNGIIKSIQYTD